MAIKATNAKNCFTSIVHLSTTTNFYVSCDRVFRKKFDNFNNTGARMLRYYLSNDSKFSLKSHFWRENVIKLCFQNKSVHYSGKLHRKIFSISYTTFYGRYFITLQNK